MIVFRLLGWLLLFLGIILCSHDVFRGLTSPIGFAPLTLADAWNAWSPGAADNFQGAIKLQYGDTVWAVLTIFLNGWAFALLLIPGMILEIIFRPKTDKSFKRAQRMTRENALEARKANARLRRKLEARTH